MKKFTIFILSLMMAMTTVACAEDNAVTDPDLPQDKTTSIQDGKILIVFFSRTGYNYPNQWLEIGHTARVAGFIKDLTGGDSFEIVPVVPYPDDYEETKTISTNERDNDLRPEFKGEIDNIDEYDMIFIGGPVWYGGMPMIIHTFYDKYKEYINGKTIAPFSTHAGSGLADAASLARSYCPDSKVLTGLAVQGTNSINSKEDVRKWLQEIGIISGTQDNAAVNSISSDISSDSRYYNLQGVSITNPSDGIYVQVSNGKSTKIKL